MQEEQRLANGTVMYSKWQIPLQALKRRDVGLHCAQTVHKAETETSGGIGDMSKAADGAYQQIRAAIRSGALAPGEQLREEQLAEICGVSRTPIREALRRLESEQLIRKTDSQRSFVAEWSLDDIDEGFSLRAMLESHAAARAASRLTSRQLDQLREYNEGIIVAIRKDDPDVASFVSFNHAFHATIMDAAQSQRLSRILSGLVEQPIILKTAARYDREQLERSWHEHGELVLAFERADPDWAAHVMSAHIRRAFYAYSDAVRELIQQDDLPNGMKV